MDDKELAELQELANELALPSPVLKKYNFPRRDDWYKPGDQIPIKELNFFLNDLKNFYDVTYLSEIYDVMIHSMNEDHFKKIDKEYRAKAAALAKRDNSKKYNAKYKELYDSGKYGQKASEAANAMWPQFTGYCKTELKLDKSPLRKTTLTKYLGKYINEKTQ